MMFLTKATTCNGLSLFGIFSSSRVRIFHVTLNSRLGLCIYVHEALKVAGKVRIAIYTHIYSQILVSWEPLIFFVHIFCKPINLLRGDMQLHGMDTIIFFWLFI